MEDVELLQRARRLCAAAKELQLPVLVPGFSRHVDGREEREDAALNDQAADEKLPLLTAAKRKKAAKQSDGNGRKLQEEKKKRQERQLEKVKQAQERARARVARTSHLEQQQALRAAEQQQSDALTAAEQCAEKIKRAQESRQRAKQRVRMKRGEKETPPSSAAPGLRTEAAKVKSFRRETIKRLQASTQLTISSDKSERQSTPERNEDIDADQKLLERRLRHETAVRLRRMKQLAENQKRQEREEFEQGLQKFKNKLRELDRTAKGLSKQPSLPQLNNPSFETEPPRQEQFTPPPSADAPCSSPVNGKPVWHQNQDAESSSDSDDSFDARNCLSRPDQTESSSPQTAEVNTRIYRNRAKLPAWKQPPVPIKPMQCYSYTAILPAYSRASVTAPACTTAATLGSSTRLRAQEISRQMK